MLRPDVGARCAALVLRQAQDEDRCRPERWKNLILAGDWTQTGLPATIEGAIRSGQRAADVALAR